MCTKLNIYHNTFHATWIVVLSFANVVITIKKAAAVSLVLTAPQYYKRTSLPVPASVCVRFCPLPWATATAAPAEAAGIGPLGILGGGHALPPSRPAQCWCLAATSPHGQLAPLLGRDRTCVLQREKKNTISPSAPRVSIHMMIYLAGRCRVQVGCGLSSLVWSTLFWWCISIWRYIYISI